MTKICWPLALQRLSIRKHSRLASSIAIFTVLTALGTHAVADAVQMPAFPERPSIGMPGNINEVTRTIGIDISDIRHFSPSTIRVKAGETVRIAISNSGRVNHEMILGTANSLRNHYAVTTREGAGEHTASNLVAVEAGQTRELVWRFNRTGQVVFGCLLPGHYDDGTRGIIVVSSSDKPHADSAGAREATGPVAQTHPAGSAVW